MRASNEMVAAALRNGGEEVCREMVRALGSGDKAAERGARGLKKVAEAPGEALYFLRKELGAGGGGGEEVRADGNGGDAGEGAAAAEGGVDRLGSNGKADSLRE